MATSGSDRETATAAGRDGWKADRKRPRPTDRDMFMFAAFGDCASPSVPRARSDYWLDRSILGSLGTGRDLGGDGGDHASAAESLSSRIIFDDISNPILHRK